MPSAQMQTVNNHGSTIVRANLDDSIEAHSLRNS
jgi:hypothetical protein